MPPPGDHLWCWLQAHKGLVLMYLRHKAAPCEWTDTISGRPLQQPTWGAATPDAISTPVTPEVHKEKVNLVLLFLLCWWVYRSTRWKHFHSLAVYCLFPLWPTYCPVREDEVISNKQPYPTPVCSPFAKSHAPSPPRDGSETPLPLTRSDWSWEDLNHGTVLTVATWRILIHSCQVLFTSCIKHLIGKAL